MNGLISYLASMGYLSMLKTLPNFSSIGLSNKALPLQNFREGRDLHWIMCPIYVGIFPARKMVVPLENGRNAILALNRKRQFS